jgi:hypothetical protein
LSGWALIDAVPSVAALAAGVAQRHASVLPSFASGLQYWPGGGQVSMQG